MRGSYKEAGYKAMRVGLVAVLLLTVVPSSLWALGTNAIPYSDSFELYADGASILASPNTKNWWGVTNTIGTITNDPYSYVKTSLPLPPPVTHQKYLSLNAGNDVLSNKFLQASHTNVFIDMMVKFEPAPESNVPDPAGDMQAALFVDTNYNLVVYHSIRDQSLGTFSNALTTLTNVTVSSSDWVRVTIAMDYLSFQSPFSWKYFQVRLDGGSTISNDYAVVAPLNPSQTGSWFFCANQDAANTYLSSVALSGTGFIDDFVVTNDTPQFGGGVYIITPLAVPANGGSLTPGTAVALPAGSATNFAIAASNHWYIADVKVDSVSIGVTNYYEDTNIQSTYNVIAYFDAFLGSNGVPHWWLANHGLGTNDDSSGSGFIAAGDDTSPAWADWLTREDPNSTNRNFVIEDFGFIDGSNYIVWTSFTTDSSLPPFQIDMGYDMRSNDWSNLGNQMPVEGTNVWWTPDPVSTSAASAFFRLRLTDE